MVWAVRIVAVLALALAGFAGWVRLAPSDPARWHVDPVDAPDPGRPNFARIGPEAGPVYPVAPEELAARIEAVALGWPRTRRLAGAPEDLWMTYVTRSALWGFPDYTSVRVLPAEEGARLAAFARARFGRSDLGVNRARLDGWLAALAADPGVAAQ